MNTEEPMSSSYADGLSPYENKGKLGLKESFDSKDEMQQKVAQLAEMIRNAKHVVVHTGAGISTSAGIPDFRGPQGVWTLEAQGLKPTVNVSFNNAVPTKTHMALVKLVQEGLVHYIVSQNIDGLHLRSGLPRASMSELHGNMFTEKCSHCDRQYVRANATTSVGQKCLERPCPSLRPGGRPCRGKVHDTILDWEANLPERELCMAEWHSGMADLSMTLGTSLQILPSGNLPLQAKKRAGHLIICNLQPTKHDRKSDILIHSYVDEVMEELLKFLCLDIPAFCPELDPTRRAAESLVEWTISTRTVQTTRKLSAQVCKPVVKRKASKGNSLSSSKKTKVEEEEENDAAEVNVVQEDQKCTPFECEPAITNSNAETECDLKAGADITTCQSDIKTEVNHST